MSTIYQLNKRAKKGEQVEGFENQLKNNKKSLFQILDRLKDIKKEMEDNTDLYSSEDIEEVKRVHNEHLEDIKSKLDDYSNL